MINKKYSKLLIELAEKDQELRKNLKISIQEIFLYDSKTTKTLKKIVGEVGWPTIQRVGVEASHFAWLIAIHSKDRGFLIQVAKLILKYSDGEVTREEQAFMIDRVLETTLNCQLYGTLASLTGDIQLLDPEHIDSRRKAMGLDSLKQQRVRYKLLRSKVS